MYEVEVEIKGASPLLHNRFAIEEEKSRKKKTEYKPEEEAEKACYRNSEGQLIQPSSHIEASMTKAGTEYILKGRKTYKDFIKSSIFIDPDEIVLTCNGKPIKKYVIDARPVNIQRNKVMCWRPRYDNWDLKFKLKVLQDIDEKTLKEILEQAGRFYGIGDYRPKFGRFEVTKFKVID